MKEPDWNNKYTVAEYCRKNRCQGDYTNGDLNDMPRFAGKDLDAYLITKTRKGWILKANRAFYELKYLAQEHFKKDQQARVEKKNREEREHQERIDRQKAEEKARKEKRRMARKKHEEESARRREEEEEERKKAAELKQERNIREGIPEKYWGMNERNQRAMMRIDENSRRENQARIELREKQEQRKAKEEENKLIESKRSHEISLKGIDLQIEETRAESMREMMAMMKEMNMSVEDMKKMMEDL